MKHIQAPAEYVSNWKVGQHLPYSIFLAGGISNCPDWQSILATMLGETPLVVINPRRKDFDESDPNMTVEQIAWEHRHMSKVDAIAFWFCKETVCPITLFEYGKCLGRGGKKLFVGCEEGYTRTLDVVEQTRHENQRITVRTTPRALLQEIHDWVITDVLPNSP